MDPLTRRILRYQQTGEERDGILTEVSGKVIAFPRQHHRWDDEACADFLTHMYPRIQGMIDRFDHRGVPFDGYLATALSYQCRSFAVARKREEARWRLAEDRVVWQTTESPTGSSPESQLIAAQPVPDQQARRVFDIGPEGRIGTASGRRKLLIVSLKHYHRLPSGGVRTLARLSGESEDRLHALIAELHDLLEPQRERTREYRTRRNRAFSRLCLLERQLSRETDEGARSSLRWRCDQLRASVMRNQKTLAHVRLNPTNQQIARILRMPKGTVDSILHRLKRHAILLYPSEHADYA